MVFELLLQLILCVFDPDEVIRKEFVLIVQNLRRCTSLSFDLLLVDESLSLILLSGPWKLPYKAFILSTGFDRIVEVAQLWLKVGWELRKSLLVSLSVGYVQNVSEILEELFLRAMLLRLLQIFHGMLSQDLAHTVSLKNL